MHEDIKQSTGMIDAGFGEDLTDLPRPTVWTVAREGGAFATLNSDLSVDVAVVGGGITGITTAAQLARAGRTVAVLEALQVGHGTTGHSTGNLYALVDESLYKLGKKWGDDVVEMVVRSRADAIALVERHVTGYRLRCNFARQPWVLYATGGVPDEDDHVEHECQAARALRLDAKLTDDLPLPYPVGKALVVRNQAQFNPYAYVRQLAAAIQSQQCRIHENTRVVDIDVDAGIVHTEIHTVRADHIVLATHTPKGFHMVQTELGPYREYAVAAPIDGHPLPGGIFWSAGQRMTSIRAVDVAGRPHVLIIGEKHKTGQMADTEGAYRQLEALLRTRFGARDMAFRWSAQHYRAADGLPYIGSSAGSSHLYLATGFATDGLTYGTLAGMLLADEICGVQNPFAELYSPRRFTPMKSAKNFLKENLNVAGQYIQDYTQGALFKRLSDVARGEGRLVEVDGDKLAVYRDERDQLHIVSPVCTHLKCIVHWNSAELSWDCPCHGSRFDYDGDVIEGPALTPLQRHGAVPEAPIAVKPGTSPPA